MKWLNIKQWGVCFVLFFVSLGQSARAGLNPVTRVVASAGTVVEKLSDALPEIPDTVIKQPFDMGAEVPDTQPETPDTLHSVSSSRPGSYRYERHRQKMENLWMRVIPSQACVQYAGSIGFLNFGLGWHYGRRDRWETELLVGFVPKYHSGVTHTTFTVKQRFVPWNCKLGDCWSIEPLTTGLFFNTISGDDFWKREPEKYPKRYYGFSTKIRTNLYVGQRIKYHIPGSKRIFHQAFSLYYEISTCDLYLISKVTNKNYPWRETLSLAFGARWEM